MQESEEGGWRSRGLLIAGAAAVVAAAAGAVLLMTRGKTGKGKKRLPTGEHYEGDLVNGRAEGFGVAVDEDKRAKMTGYWKDDLPHGAVKSVFGEHAFEGEAFGSRWKGTIRLANGSEMDLDGSLDVATSFMSGEVVTRTPDGHEAFRGTYVNNLPEGQCRAVFPEGVYEGAMRQGVKEGRGTLTGDGVVYEGDWKGGHKHGHGKMQYANGEVYEGTWREGRWLDGLLRRPDGRTDTVLEGKIFK
jgi:hypothetical protein